MAKLTKSTSNLNDVIHTGRPRNEEPHVKRTTKKKADKIEYIVRVNLDKLKIDDDEFDDLQSLYMLFDLDRDGCLNFKEFEKLLRCLGYRCTEEQAQEMATTVSVDTTMFSVSFNEFLTFMSKQQETEPDEETLIDIFTSLDKDNTGKISESSFRQIMKGKDDCSEEDIDDMLKEFYRLLDLKGLTDSMSAPPTPAKSIKQEEEENEEPKTPSKKKKGGKTPLTPEPEPEIDVNERWIDYREFAAMLQN
ncbi:CALM [Lepeophtheirus salmonis]|uniref:CALM n=1 Tax=Lepeophtheirus salmonis TaxID=72036 RepID=A0A7R8CS98_LEPSM|nr:calmodulin-alpha-like isoform X2 [Lepeophtheirus salmonis]XP_040566911.1 calmodulin-alpha-like isoform X2 [Lepeophtheirus salmonis]XP_040566912.1 calmodulin-alpha-like isoform X2 [Lepeophtheirus salmonis]CAB4062985.1 CALM [Lepeophtheirus salmonis]CAF2914921.1 CALM [Lepeophtheirus salmonis]